MKRQQVTPNHQQSKKETPLVRGILQRAAVHFPEEESSHYTESRFHQDFSRIPVTSTAPIVQAKSVVSEEEKSNKTGLPNELKAGIENLSGIAMDDVRVHYNSPKPSQLQALAYTQGTDIHVAPQQEKHLPHEAWHVVQQKQGRVKPTMQMKGVEINDDLGLEREADVMGEKGFMSLPVSLTPLRQQTHVLSGYQLPHLTNGNMSISPTFSADKDQSVIQRTERDALKYGLGGIVAGGGLGAAIGSVVPGLGTAVGAGIGGVIGGIYGAVKGARLGTEKELVRAANRGKVNSSWSLSQYRS